MDFDIVLLAQGDKYGDEYASRMVGMLRKHLSASAPITLFTDRERAVPSEVRQVSTVGWDADGWFGKLKLFDRNILASPFFFLDISTVVLRDLSPLVEFWKAHEECPLIAMRDWNYDCFGSMVLLVRPNEVTQGIWDAYASGKRYQPQTAIDGDQDFIDGYLREHPEFPVMYFPEEWCISYKRLRKLHATNPLAAAKALQEGLLLKFHGPPKMHQLLDPWANLKLLLKTKPLRTPKYWRYLEREVREWWTNP